MSADRSIPGVDSNSFPRSARLLSPSAYSAVFSSRKNIRLSDSYWTVLAVRNSIDPSFARLGLAISKKRARRAVDRNRLKRLVRESFRQSRDSLKGYDIVVMNRDRCVHTGNKELQSALEEHWVKLVTTKSTVNNPDKRRKGHSQRSDGTAGKKDKSGSGGGGERENAKNGRGMCQ